MHSPPLSCKISNVVFEPSRVELMKVQFPRVVKLTQRASNLLQHPPNPLHPPLHCHPPSPHTHSFSFPHCCCSSSPLLLICTAQPLLRAGAHHRIARTDPSANKLLLSPALTLVLITARSKGKCNKALLASPSLLLETHLLTNVY